MTARLLSTLVGVLADRFRTTTGDATGPAAAMWSPYLGRNRGHHTGRPATGVRRHSGLHPHGIIVTVQDPGSTQIPCVRNSSPNATGGRGLLLVNELATRWGFHRDPTGTVIWFEFGSSG